MELNRTDIDAKMQNKLEKILKPWISFRLYIRFSKAYYNHLSKKYDKQWWFNAAEHDCSYSQCAAGYKKKIFLNKLKGYRELIERAENIEHKYEYAVIYGRTEMPGGSFDMVCRKYDKERKLKDVQDPVITDADNITLHFDLVNGYLLNLRSEKEKFFADEISKNLK